MHKPYIKTFLIVHLKKEKIKSNMRCQGEFPAFSVPGILSFHCQGPGLSPGGSPLQ